MKKVVLKLGGFHTEMSFLGAIGHLMAESGLKQVLETIYASVEHILSGKAISRAVRAHLRVNAILNGLLLAECLQISSVIEDSDIELNSGSVELKTTETETETQVITPEIKSFKEVKSCYDNIIELNS